MESRGTFTSQGRSIAVERYEPEPSGRAPAVLVLHGAGGMRVGGPAFRDVARRLVGRGYVAHVVHYFDRTGTVFADDRAIATDHAAWMATVADAVGDVASRPGVDGGRIGLLGFSLGSYLALAAAAADPRVSAVVEYCGGLPAALVRDVTRLPPTLILHGEADAVVPVREARALESRLREAGVPHELHIYPGQGHVFTGPDAEDAMARAFAFFDAHLKGVPGGS